MDEPLSSPLGISAIATYEPPWVLGNDWFGDTIPRKFVHHTGIESRSVSLEDEVTIGLRAVRQLQRETGCDLNDCAAVVFVSPSYIPLSSARRLMDPLRAEQERLHGAARHLVRRLGIADCGAVGLNWFCSGYSRAVSIACRRIAPRIALGPNQFIVVVTASRISRITDYSCKQTAGLFGDLATATLLTRTDSHKYPVHFDILRAEAEKQPAEAAYFDFHVREHVPVPQADGGVRHAEQRVVFSLNGMAIADLAPRAMSSAVTKALEATGIRGGDVRFVVPHQAGSAIVRFTGMKLESSGIGGELINGLTQKLGNVSSGSIPFALRSNWQRLSGLIACPTVAVGSPGVAEVSQGCILLRATPLHERQRQAAA